MVNFIVQNLWINLVPYPMNLMQRVSNFIKQHTMYGVWCADVDGVLTAISNFIKLLIKLDFICIVCLFGFWCRVSCINDFSIVLQPTPFLLIYLFHTLLLQLLLSCLPTSNKYDVFNVHLIKLPIYCILAKSARMHYTFYYLLVIKYIKLLYLFGWL